VIYAKEVMKFKDTRKNKINLKKSILSITPYIIIILLLTLSRTVPYHIASCDMKYLLIAGRWCLLYSDCKDMPMLNEKLNNAFARVMSHPSK